MHPLVDELCDELDHNCDEGRPEDGMVTVSGWDGEVEAVDDVFEGGEWGAPWS